MTPLEKLGEQRKQTLRDLAAINRRIRDVAKSAHQAGMKKQDIARTARVSRPTLDKMLREEGQ